MLADFVALIITPISPYLRVLGYLDEALAMRRRYQRNREYWRSHLGNTRNFVLATAEKIPNRKRIVILGSGLLLDVPLAELAGMFREIILKDVVCLPEARKQIRKYENVKFIEQDVTNIASRLFENGRQNVARLPEADETLTDVDVELVISLNILSQLWVVPRSFTARYLENVSRTRIDEWCREIVEAHYNWLRSLSCNVCLVADFEQVKRNRESIVISRGSTIYDLRLPEPDTSWTWNIVPRGKDSPHTSKELIVGGWYFPANNRC